MSFRTPAKLARVLQGVAAIPSRAAPAVAARLDQLARDEGLLGEVGASASGAGVTIWQKRPSPGAPPVRILLVDDELPATWREAIAEETSKALAEALRGGS